MKYVNLVNNSPAGGQQGRCHSHGDGFEDLGCAMGPGSLSGTEGRSHEAEQDGDIDSLNVMLVA